MWCGEDPRRQRRSDAGAACGQVVRAQSTHAGAEPDARADRHRTRRHPFRPARPQRAPTVGTHRRLPVRATPRRPHRYQVRVTHTLAQRAISLEAEVTEIDRLLKNLVAETAPELAAIVGVGTDVATALLVAAGDNPQRLRSEAPFAHLCGVAPIDASSGKQERHRLNRGGDRQANSALWHILITRMVCDQRTRDYIARRTDQGRTKKEAIRCLKRYIAREVYRQLPRPQLTLD